ncbi:hypothetical protein [Phenylobacterium aquaticum]|uniref:hypothetical protein n=1 Tax=Phenylobacterium aquaticum TaxID=1763816 RepID=UPI0026EFA3AB|nr:hypothetical protein [Phenylobacterium aquaticum]
MDLRWKAGLTPRRVNILIGVLAFGWLAALSLERGLWTGVTAAWVQALGSVAAIGASTAAAFNLAHRERAATVRDARQFAMAAAFDVLRYYAILVATVETPKVATQANIEAAWERVLFADQNLAAACTPQLGSATVLGALNGLRHITHATQLRLRREGVDHWDPRAIAPIAGKVAEVYDQAARAVGGDTGLYPRLLQEGRMIVQASVAGRKP